MELKFPSENTPPYTWTEYKRERESGTYPGSEGSFCRTFMEAVEREIQKNLGSRTPMMDTSVKGLFRDVVEAADQLTGHERGDSKIQYGHMIEVCDHINRTFDGCRDHVNNAMVEFLTENDGVIDRWPETNDACGIAIEHRQLGLNAPPLEFPLEYFGSKYVPAGYKVHRETGTTPQWKKKTCSPGSSAEIEELWDRYKEIDGRYHVEQGTRDVIGILKSACILLVPILTAAFLIFSLIWYFMGVDPSAQTITWFFAAEATVPKWLLFLPKLLLSAIAFISSLLRLNTVVFWVGTLLVTLLGGIASVSVLSRPYAMPVKKSVLRKSKAESQQVWDEYQDAKRRWQEISDAWNEKYFEYYKNRRSF